MPPEPTTATAGEQPGPAVDADRWGTIRGAGTLALSDDEFAKLRRFNLYAFVLHLVSAIAVLALNNGFRVGVSGFWLNGPPGSSVTEGVVTEAFTYPLGVGVAAFLLLSALFHLIVASPLGSSKYRSEIEHGRNRFRWVEYSLSATLMILLISTITGITDITALIAIAVCNVSMILFGWIMEVVNVPNRRTWWTPFGFGCIAGAGPWLAIATGLIYGVNSFDGAQGPPSFVYGIIVSLFVLFNCFAINQWLQYRGIGPWRRYLFGERVYIVLSFVAKSALAWQVFANVLV